MRLATFNLQHGLAHVADEDARVDLDRLVAAVDSLDADVLALQEVDRGQPRSGGLDLTTLLARACGMASWHFQPVLAGAVGQDTLSAATGDEPTESPAYGLAILSRYPARDWQSLRLPQLPIRYPTRRADGLVRVPEEPRSALRVTLDTPDGALTVVNTHLTFVIGSHIRQLRRITSALDGVPDPVVLLGDLNLAAPWPGRVTGYTPLAEALTFPAHDPERQIDHILARGLRAEPGTADAPPRDVSDHRPLLVDVTLP